MGVDVAQWRSAIGKFGGGKKRGVEEVDKRRMEEEAGTRRAMLGVLALLALLEVLAMLALQLLSFQWSFPESKYIDGIGFDMYALLFPLLTLSLLLLLSLLLTPPHPPLRPHLPQTLLLLFYTHLLLA